MSVPCITCRTEYSSAEAHFQLQMRCGIRGGAMFAAVPAGCYLPAHLQVSILFLQAGGSRAITMLCQKQVVCNGFMNFCHELILCHGCSEATRRKRGWGACMKCASKSGSFFHDKASVLTFCFLDAKGKWRGSTKRRRPGRQSGQRGTSSLDTIPGCGGWLSPLWVLRSHVCCHSLKAALIARSSLSQA